jgi:hypothetical protein
MKAPKDLGSIHLHFDAPLVEINSHVLVRIPLNVSSQLPSRGLVMAKGTLNGVPFQSPLEPDGKKSHWFKVEKNMLKDAKADVGDSVSVEIEPVKDFPEPKIPADVQAALKDDLDVRVVWEDITPLARWDWLRWIQGTKNPETRTHRIEVMLSKIRNGKRNACCFNRSECTDPEVSHRGMLLEPK